MAQDVACRLGLLAIEADDEPLDRLQLPQEATTRRRLAAFGQQRLQVSPASVSKAIAFLEEQGLIRRERDERRRERYFVDEGCGRLTMDMVLQGPEFLLARNDLVLGDFVLPSLEIAGPGGHWVEFSRPICAGEPNAATQSALEAYHEYFEAATRTMKAGASARSRQSRERGSVRGGFGWGAGACR